VVGKKSVALKIGVEMDTETSVIFNQLTLLLAPDYVNFGHPETSDLTPLQ
jgi:hypothetical protein